MTNIARRTTEHYDVGRFPAHGRVELSFDGTLMRFESTGPFNRELMLAAELAMRELIAEQPPTGPWAEIVRLHGSALIAMDVMPALAELIAGFERDGISSVATVLVASDDNDGFALMVRPYAAVYAAARRPFATFASYEEGERWIAGQLAAARKST